MKVNHSALTNVGRKRKHNEDAYALAPDIHLYVVCDGMGGAEAGEVASQVTSNFIVEYLTDKSALLEEYKTSPNSENKNKIINLIKTAVASASKKVWDMAIEDPSKRGMGTTLVLSLFCGPDAFVAHVGDSRVYLWRGGEVHQLTEDHSLLNELVKAGQLTPEEAAKDPRGNVITRAIGPNDYVEADVLTMEIMAGDTFLLCSDGLCGYFDGVDIKKFFKKTDLKELTTSFIAFANLKGGKDNITSVVARIEELARDTSENSRVDKKIAILLKIPLFKRLTYLQVVQMLEIIKVKEYAPKQVIVKQNELGQEMFILLTGEVVVLKEGKAITKLVRGQFFGEMSLLDQAPRSATITASAPTMCMIIKRSSLFDLFAREPRIAIKILWAFLQNFNRRLRTIDSKNFESLTLPPLPSEDDLPFLKG